MPKTKKSPMQIPSDSLFGVLKCEKCICEGGVAQILVGYSCTTLIVNPEKGSE